MNNYEFHKTLSHPYLWAIVQAFSDKEHERQTVPHNPTTIYIDKILHNFLRVLHGILVLFITAVAFKLLKIVGPTMYTYDVVTNYTIRQLIFISLTVFLECKNKLVLPAFFVRRHCISFNIIIMAIHRTETLGYLLMSVILLLLLMTAHLSVTMTTVQSRFQEFWPGLVAIVVFRQTVLRADATQPHNNCNVNIYIEQQQTEATRYYTIPTCAEKRKGSLVYTLIFF